MAFASWFCINNTKTMFLKIVHPGGHVELHDRPVLAAEIMLQNPRYCVAYPHVFKQPSAIVPPETTLMPGQKFYVVPLSTIRKLQMLSSKYSPSSAQEVQRSQHTEEHGIMDNSCWFFRNKNSPKPPSACLQKSNRFDKESISIEKKKDGFNVDDNCFTCLLTGIMIKASNDSPSKETIQSSSFGSSETRILASKKTNDDSSRKEGLPMKVGSFHEWQPSLEIICEE